MSIALPTEPSNVKAKPPTPMAARVFIGGAPKTGKTTLAAQWAPDTTIFLDLQHGTDLLPGDHYVTHCNDWTDFSNACTAIGAGGHKFQTVVIDPIDQAYKFADAYAGQQHGKAAAGMVDWGKGTAQAEGIFREAIGKLLARRGMGIWFIGHTELVTRDEKEQLVPKLDKKVREWITGEVEHIFIAERIGNRTVLHTKASNKYEAGSRLQLPEPLPMDARQIYEAMQQGIAALTQEAPK